MKTRNDCEIACDCVKRANVVLHVGLCKEIFARKHTATHKPTSAQPLYSYQRDIHLIIVCGDPRAYGLAGQLTSTLPLQLRPLPENPVLHEQSNDPGVSEHCAFASQLLFSRHSLMFSQAVPLPVKPLLH